MKCLLNVRLWPGTYVSSRHLLFHRIRAEKRGNFLYYNNGDFENKRGIYVYIFFMSREPTDTFYQTVPKYCISSLYISFRLFPLIFKIFLNWTFVEGRFSTIGYCYV